MSPLKYHTYLLQFYYNVHSVEESKVSLGNVTGKLKHSNSYESIVDWNNLQDLLMTQNL